MLDVFRRHSRGLVAKMLMGFLIISFGIWGIADVFNRFVDRDVAKVGSTRIGLEQFREMYRERLRVIGSQIGRNISYEQARALGIDRQILSEYISENTLDENARSLGLSLSNEDLIKRIQANPAFRGSNGQFDPNRFEMVIQNNGYSEARYLEVERRLALRHQIARALSGEVQTPEVLANAVRRYEAEERNIDFVKLDRASAGNIPNPTPEQISEYFESRKASFRAPEHRKLVVLSLTPEAVANTVQISDDDLKKAFDAQRERLSVPERREVEQIIFPTIDDAKAALQKINGGAKFEDIGKERGLSPADMSLGVVAKREITDPAIANAAFSVAQGKVSEPAEGRFGFALVRINKIVPGKEAVFAEQTDAIRKQLSTDRARRAILDLHNKIEDERASGSNLSEIAAKTNLKAITVDAVDRSGRAPDGKPVEKVLGLEQLLGGAFSTPVGTETDPIDLRSQGGYVWYEVAGITPSRDRTLDEVRDRVEQRWRDDEVAKRLNERAEAMKKRLDANEPFSAVAQGMKVETRSKLTRNNPVEGIDNRALAAIFETPQGKSGISISDDQINRIVFRVTGVDLPAPQPGKVSARVANLGNSIQDDMFVEYVLRLQDEVGVSINESNFRNVTGAAAGN